MKELLDLIAQYPLWMKLTIVGLAALIVLLLVTFYPKGAPVDKAGAMVSPANGIRLGSALFLDVSTSVSGFYCLLFQFLCEAIFAPRRFLPSLPR